VSEYPGISVSGTKVICNYCAQTNTLRKVDLIRLASLASKSTLRCYEFRFCGVMDHGPMQSVHVIISSATGLSCYNIFGPGVNF
jgi:hypothetical protein